MATPTAPQPTSMADMEEIYRQFLLGIRILERTAGKLDTKEQK
jgi:hypothetical protein